MDEVFGPENFVSEVTFKKTGGQSSRTLANVADYILWFAKDGRAVKYRELFETKRPGQEGATQYTWIEDGDKRRSLRAGEEPSSNARLFQPYPLTSDGPASEPQPFEWREATYQPSRGSHWKVPVRGLGQVAIADRLIAQGKTLRFVNYLDDYPVTPRTNIWTDTQTSGFGADRVYVVQTLPRVVERCMLMCTDPGELVLDPTCGSGTTAFVAEQWGRRWITIDTSRVALALARQRLMGAKYPMYLLADSDNGKFKEAEVSQQPRVGGASTNDIRHGFVYERSSTSP